MQNRPHRLRKKNTPIRATQMRPPYVRWATSIWKTGQTTARRFDSPKGRQEKRGDPHTPQLDPLFSRTKADSPTDRSPTKQKCPNACLSICKDGGPAKTGCGRERARNTSTPNRTGRMRLRKQVVCNRRTEEPKSDGAKGELRNPGPSDTEILATTAETTSETMDNKTGFSKNATPRRSVSSGDATPQYLYHAWYICTNPAAQSRASTDDCALACTAAYGHEGSSTRGLTARKNIRKGHGCLVHLALLATALHPR